MAAADSGAGALRHVSVVKPIVYGTAAFWLGPGREEGQHSHRWTVYVRGANGEDLSYFVKKVVFTLHQSFVSPVREVTQPPFEVTETGWGEFDIPIKIYFHDLRESPAVVNHFLRLYEGNTPPSMTKPVLSEHYDELVFYNPGEQFHKMLIAGPTRQLGDHPLSEWWDQQSYAAAAQAEAVKLRNAQLIVDRKLLALRKRLHDAEEDIKNMLVPPPQQPEPGPGPAPVPGAHGMATAPALPQP